MGGNAVARAVLCNVFMSLAEEDAQILAQAGKQQEQRRTFSVDDDTDCMHRCLMAVCTDHDKNHSALFDVWVSTCLKVDAMKVLLQPSLAPCSLLPSMQHLPDAATVVTKSLPSALACRPLAQ